MLDGEQEEGINPPVHNSSATHNVPLEAHGMPPVGENLQNLSFAGCCGHHTCLLETRYCEAILPTCPAMVAVLW